MKRHNYQRNIKKISFYRHCLTTFILRLQPVDCCNQRGTVLMDSQHSILASCLIILFILYRRPDIRSHMAVVVALEEAEEEDQAVIQNRIIEGEEGAMVE